MKSITRAEGDHFVEVDWIKAQNQAAWKRVPAKRPEDLEYEANVTKLGLPHHDLLGLWKEIFL